MGEGAALAAVADSGPIIHLHEIGQLPLLGIFSDMRAAYQQKISRTEAEDCLQRLYDGSSLFVTRAIVELAIDQLRQLP